MSVTLQAPSKLGRWQVLSTPPLSGAENMAFDVATATAVEAGRLPPTLRFFRWSRPTVSYGRLQKLEKLSPPVPQGWESVQRPTGGGVVYHDKDLCLSLCWRTGEAPMPASVKDHYKFIHAIIQQGLQSLTNPQMASCHDCSSPKHAFDARQCFSEPVVYDLLAQGEKIVGGALAHRGRTMLYQGSIQRLTHPDLENKLIAAFSEHFSPVSGS